MLQLFLFSLCLLFLPRYLVLKQQFKMPIAFDVEVIYLPHSSTFNR